MCICISTNIHTRVYRARRRRPNVTCETHALSPLSRRALRQVFMYVALQIMVPASSALRRLPSLQLLRWWRWAQMLAPPQSLQALLMRLCRQMLVPPQSLHCFLPRWCSQILAPPHSRQSLRMRWCGQMLAPPHRRGRGGGCGSPPKLCGRWKPL